MKYMEPSEGWWTGHGFESFGEYLRYSQTGPDRPFSFVKNLKKRKPPAARLPSGGVPAQGAESSARSRQISIRLDEEGYQALVKVAKMYGVRPSTMGRLLVQRGAGLALESA